MLYKPDHSFAPDLTTTSGLAAHFRNQTAKHFELFCFSLRQAAVLSARELRSCSTHYLRSYLRMDTMDTKSQQQTENEPISSPVVKAQDDGAVKIGDA